MKYGLIVAVLLSVAAMTVNAAQNTKEDVVEVSVAPRPSEDLNIASITYDLVTRDMGPAEWDTFVKKVQSRFRDWSHEYDNNNMKQFLDDKLIDLAPSVTSGKGKCLKEFCQWLALYKVYSEPLPHYISDISDNDKRWIRDELADFNWNRTALKIKENHQK